MALARDFVLLATASLLLAGCANLLAGGVCGNGFGMPQWAPNAVATQPVGPLRIDLEICDPDGFFQDGSEVVLTLYPNFEERIVAGVALPDGVRQLSGSTSYVGTPEVGTPHYVRSVLRAEEPGRYDLRGWGEATSWGFNGSRAAPSETTGIEGGPRGADVVEPCLRGRMAGCQPPGVRIDLNVTDTDPSTVTVRLSAPDRVYGRGMFYTDAVLRPPWRVVDLVLLPGQTTLLQAQTSVPRPDIKGENDRGYSVSFFFYPHPSIDSNVFKETAVVAPTQ